MFKNMTNAELQFMATVSSQMRIIAKQLERLNENFETLISNIKPNEDGEQSHLNQFYHQCVEFWKRMGVQQEDNLIALALLDIKNSFHEKAYEEYLRQAEWNTHYCEVADKAIDEINKDKYNERRGMDGFLSESGL